MASYLDQLRITLDEAEEMEMEGGELSGDVTESIEDEANTDEVMEESAALEEDLEAMQENADATSELVETEAATDAVLDAPDEHSESEMEAVAEATQDSFMVTLAKLGVQREDMKHFGVTSDSSLSPLERIKITNDGVKDFLSRLKEHIIAFFRTVKNKIKKLIAKLVVMVTGCTKKADAVIKKYKNRLKKHDTFELRQDKTTMMKIVKPAPLIFVFYGDSMAKLSEAVEKTYSKPHTNLIKDLSTNIVNMLQGSYVKYQKEGKGEIKKVLESLTKASFQDAFQTNVAHVLLKGYSHGERWVIQDDYISTFKATKVDYVASRPFAITAGIGPSIKLLRFVVNEDSENWVPSIEIGTVTIKQSKIDSAMPKLKINGDDVRNFLEAVYQASKQVKGLTDGCYRHLEDAEKSIINACNKAEREGEVKNGDIIKISSVFRNAVSTATFSKVMEYALGCRRLLSLGVNMAEALLEDEKQKKKDDKRLGISKP